MTEEEFLKIIRRLRGIHKAERRRAWWLNRLETLALSAAFCGIAWFMWRDDDTMESAFFGAFALLLALVAFTE